MIRLQLWMPFRICNGRCSRGINRFGFVMEPDFVVDVKSTFDTKRLMLEAHASQREWVLADNMAWTITL